MRLAGPIADALRRGAAIITASPRVARALHLAFAEDQRAAGRQIWPSPPVSDWDSWLRSHWSDHAFAHPGAPMLLSPLQEQALWRRVQHDDAALVLSPDAMAALAMEAWSLLSAFDAHAARRSAWEETDAERFRQWAAEFERVGSRHNWMSASRLASTLAPLLASDQDLTLPPEVLLVGFVPLRITPAQRQFLAALESRGITVTEFHPEPDFAEPHRSWLTAADQSEEIAACAAWTRERLLAHPQSRIGIIVPGIAAVRGQIDRVFRRILMPASEDIRRPSPLMPFEFSLGQPLADVPAIRAALSLLRWIAAPISEEEISWLMLSGFVSDAVTLQPAIARHDAAQRRAASVVPERSIERYRASLAREPALRRLRDQLGALLRTVEANRVHEQSRQPSAWTELVLLLLERIGWPGERPADTIQYQALQRWQRLLDELALLDFDGTHSTFADFVALLERHARETIFAPESHDAPIQIMDPLAASGQPFDAVWFLSTDDTRWPMRGHLHPLLPPSLQRHYKMPHATAEDDWNLAHAVTAGLVAGTPDIVFSYAQSEKDAELRPSPLIASLFPPNTQPAAALASSPEPHVAASLDAIADDSGLLPWPSEQNAGGAAVLKQQAACPFQAFATKRLAARPVDRNEWGLSPAAKGKLLHVVLQRLFSEPEPALLRTRDDLVTAIATNQLAGILDAHIEAAMCAEIPEHTESGALAGDPWLTAYLAAERRRLRARLEEWLAIEARREPFTVESCEQQLPDVHIGDLRLNLRADRIDQLADGSRLLIDYKTGPVSPAAWEGERPAEPQLPLYAAYGNVENVSGILFAQIRAGETRFDGRIRDAHAQLSADIGAKKALMTDPYSDTMRSEWARALEKLAEEFLRGEAAVDPRAPKVCDICRLHSLCRVAELNLTFAGETSEEPADA